MKKTFLFLAAALMSAAMWADVTADTIFLKGFAGSTSTSYVSDLLTGSSQNGITVAASNFNPSTAQIKGNQTSATNNFYIYNTDAYPAAITKIEIIAKIDASNKFQNKMYAATGTASQAEITDVKVGAAWNLETASWTFDEADGVTYFKLYSNEKFTSGSVKEAKVVVTYGGTPTPQKELVSLEIGGTATKMEYFVGEAFNPAGLTVTATYSDASFEDVANEAAWTIEPATFTEASESASVTVKAEFNKVESDPQTITGIVVKAKPAAKYVPVAWNEIEDGGKYFITAADGKEYYFAAKAFAAKGALAIEFDASFAPEAEMWTFTKSGNAWKISEANGAGLYMKNDNNGLVCAADTGAYFTVAQGSSAEFTDLTASDGANTRYVALYNKQDFRCYKTTGSSGIRDLKLYGLKKEGVVTKPSFTPSESEFDGSVEVTLTADEGADIYYAINEEVTSMNAIQYTEPIKLTATTTIYAVAKKDGKESEQVSKTYTKIPVFESLEDLVTNLPATDKNVTVIVTITEAKIDSFYVTSQKQTNGVYTHVGETVVELYEYNVPKAWEVGGTLSATTLKAQWSLYKGTAELQKWEGGWTVFNYTAPQPTGIKNAKANVKATKAIVNGQIVIIRDNKTYNVLGF